MITRLFAQRAHCLLLCLLLGPLLGSLLGARPSLAQTVEYFPPHAAEWESRSPKSLGLNEAVIEEAVAYAQSHEYAGAKDLRMAILQGFNREPGHRLRGPSKERGGPAGMILKNGYVVAQWGDTRRVDMTFSVTKSYLSTVAGLALQEGHIRSLDDQVEEYVWDGTFSGAHNSQITWSHLLTQSSDWYGNFMGLDDWADRPPREGDLSNWQQRQLHTPGTHYKYNDVRVNVLAYSLLQVWRQPLPIVLKQHVMDPIGASSTWRWYGYDDGWVNMDGQWVQTVSGGGHHGGGLFISTEDHARFGLLFLNKGNWNGQQVLPPSWVAAVQQPSQAHASYGYMWWLNQGPRKWEGVEDENLYYAAGFGGNYIVVDQANDMVIVTRWLNPADMAGFMQIMQGATK